ncbi:NUDIX domain-containing protein [Candidatus Kaiserbacteria bacterium]|nr:NUDIX domain-containing protein [Candidatus Kaiserbacteria bacterium]
MAHIHDKIDWTVSVFIVHKDKVLLRMHEKYHTFLGVGGHIELDENPLTAAKRECMEEVGLAVHIPGEDDPQLYLDDRFQLRMLPRPAHMNIHHISDTHQHLDIIYYATTESTDVIPENPDDVWEWLTKEELEKRTDILADIKFYALGALEELGD